MTKKIGVLLIILMMAGAAGVSAETFQGEVKSIQTQSGAFTVLPKDPATGKPGKKEQKVQVSSVTLLENFESLEDLRAGDEIQGEVSNQGKTWEAQKLLLSKVKLRQ